MLCLPKPVEPIVKWDGRVLCPCGQPMWRREGRRAYPDGYEPGFGPLLAWYECQVCRRITGARPA